MRSQKVTPKRDRTPVDGRPEAGGYGRARSQYPGGESVSKDSSPAESGRIPTNTKRVVQLSNELGRPARENPEGQEPHEWILRETSEGVKVEETVEVV